MLPELLACLLECPLNNFLRILIILHQPIRDVIRGIQVRQEKLFKLGLLISHAQQKQRTVSDPAAGLKYFFRMPTIGQNYGTGA
jgi:hypothetical protein